MRHKTEPFAQLGFGLGLTLRDLVSATRRPRTIA